MRRPSEPGRDPTPRHTSAGERAAPFAAGRFGRRSPGGRRASAPGPGAGRGSRSAEPGRLPEAAGREVGAAA